MRKSFYSNLSEGEIQFYEKWNSNTDDSTLRSLITEVISAQAKHNSNLPAVEYDNKQLTYSELESSTNQLARYLRKNFRVKEEDRIGIFLNSSLYLPLAVLSVLKSSAAFVPLDPNYPQDRLAFMIEDANLSVILSTSDLVDSLPPTACTVLQVDTQQSEFEKLSTDRVDINLHSSSLAYVIYTSGSTGRPKGVMIEHRGIANMAIAEAHSYRVGIGDRVLQFASINFDGSVCEIFMTWAVGGVLCLIDNEERNAGRSLNNLLRNKKINVITLTPTVLAATPSADLPELKTIGSVGESCFPDIIEKWGKGRHFINAFGPTENTVVATAAEKQDCYPSITIGKPIPNVRVYTIDEDNKQVGVDQVGEIAIAGIQVARGYHNQPDLTAERFIRDPLSDDSSDLLYKSGDFGKITVAGNLEYIGRMDDQVKLRGLRIELGEIENVVNNLTSVKQSAIVLTTTQYGDKRIVAYVSGDTSTEELREHIAGLLPTYMIPNHFIFVESLPVTPNGKVDKKLLQSRTITQTVKVEGPAPTTATEIKLADIWTTLLEIGEVSKINNFFELGGDSLLAVQLMECISERLNVEPDLRILTLGTLSEVAHHCDEILEIRNSSWSYRLRKILGFA